MLFIGVLDNLRKELGVRAIIITIIEDAGINNATEAINTRKKTRKKLLIQERRHIMKIKDIELFQLEIPLKKPFSTSLHTVKEARNTVVRIVTDDGRVGWGEGSPTEVITGDSNASIRGYIENCLKPILLGEEAGSLEKITSLVQDSGAGNTNAKAAVEMAVYDLFGQQLGVPVYQFLGGYQNKLQTDMTVSVAGVDEMEKDARKAVEAGFPTLKLKVGKDLLEDLERVKTVRSAVGSEINIRLDANQGWQPKEAVKIIREMEELGLDIELVEQPVLAEDFAGMKYVKDNVLTPIMADESLFSPRDAIRLIKEECCDLFNIKLMKSGGLSRALMINSVAEAAGIECMLGCMLESKIAITAAAQLAGARRNITRLDLDAPLLLAENPVQGGISYQGPQIELPRVPGLGISKVENLKKLR